MGKLFEKRVSTKLIAGVVASVIIAAGAATSAFSFSWFTNKNNITNSSLVGHTAGAYFARGTGTSDDPYVINKPIHLYNLAWLQYIGYFTDETYFIIEDDLDMSGWTLPPIGTTNHPFIGHLDGYDKTHGKNQEHAAVISNLTISNDYSDYNRHPSSITNVSGLNCMGFFGVFGKEGESYEDDKAPSAKNFYLKGLSVESEESSNLIGMAAGYVNGVLEGVGVADSKIELPTDKTLSTYGSYTSNLSDYTTVGYCEEKYRSSAYDQKVKLQASDVETSQGTEGDSGSESGNGGSLDMNAMYTDLLSLWNSSTNVTHPTTRTIKIDVNGNVTEDTYSDYKEDQRYYSSSNNSYYYYYAETTKQKDDQTAASYCFAKRSGSTSYIYLYGATEVTPRTNTTLTTTTTTAKLGTRQLVALSDSSKQNYLYISNGTIGNTVDSANATYFRLTTDGYLESANSDTTYYLVNDSGTLETTTSSSSASTWENDESLGTYVSETKCLQYSSDKGWHLESSTYYAITDLSYKYWIVQDTSSSSVSLKVANGESYESDAVHWDLNGNSHYYTKINGTTYYLGTDSTSGSITGLTTSESNAFTYNSKYFRKGSWYRYYYMSASGESLTISTNTGWQFEIKSETNTVDSLGFTYQDESYTYDETTTSTSSATYQTKPTFFPISGDDGIPNVKNTGYVISGANVSVGTGDIRVSQYKKSGNLSITTLYSINDDGVFSGTPTSSTFSSFKHLNDDGSAEGAYTKFSKIFNSDNTYVYGLHFMDAQISTSNKVIAEYARIKNNEFTNYELPEDSIDFNLYKKGYINFFAGTYFSGNTSFFSLHEIERDGSNIKNIREIEEIYETTNSKKSQSYVYKYKNEDGTTSYTVPYLHGSNGKRYHLNGLEFTSDEPIVQSTFPTEGNYSSDAVFKSSWIGARSSLRSSVCFYFEIPTNAGEYALGSVSGSDGAYLCYLDIGANSQRTDISQIRELKTISTYMYTYAKGVSFSFIGDDLTALPAIDAKNNASFSLTTSFSGEMSVVRDDTSIEYTSSNTSVVTEYKYRDLTVSGNGTNIPEATGTLTEKTEINTITRITYSLFSEESTTLTYKKTTTTKDGSRTTTNTTIDNDGNESEDTSSWPVDLDWDTSVNDTATIYAFYVDGKSVTLEVSSVYAENFDADEGTYYYKLGGYKVTVTNDVDVEVVMTELVDLTLYVKLKTGTGDTDDDYTTLELNVAKTITA